jgi:TRAP-type mannitol/chloroaromatic compound transport system permease small subunit
MLNKLHLVLNQINEWVGRSVAWLVLAMTLVTFAIVVLRYGFNFGSIAMQESVVYLHCFIFMLAIGYTLKHDQHVRVDVFYQYFTERQKAWVNLLGSIFLLLPVCGFLLYSSWDYTSNSWQIHEESPEAGGLPLVFILKTLIPVMPTLLASQVIANMIDHLKVLRSTSQVSN